MSAAPDPYVFYLNEACDDKDFIAFSVFFHRCLTRSGLIDANTRPVWRDRASLCSFAAAHGEIFECAMHHYFVI